MLYPMGPSWAPVQVWLLKSWCGPFYTTGGERERKKNKKLGARQGVEEEEEGSEGERRRKGIGVNSRREEIEGEESEQEEEREEDGRGKKRRYRG